MRLHYNVYSTSLPDKRGRSCLTLIPAFSPQGRGGGQQHERGRERRLSRKPSAPFSRETPLPSPDVSIIPQAVSAESETSSP